VSAPGVAGTIDDVADPVADPVPHEPTVAEPAPERSSAPRAKGQLLLGIVPLTLVCLVLLSLLGAALPAARAPLSAATQTATAEVVDNGVGPDGRGVEVTYTDNERDEQNATIILARPEDIPEGAEIGVQYDPADPAVVYAEGDAAHLTVRNLLFGLFWIGLVLAICLGLTVFRVFSRPRLLRRQATSVTARRVRVRRGLSDRSWLVLDHAGAAAWIPVYWDEAVSSLKPNSSITVHGNPGRDRLVMPVIAGRPIWPSGGRRGSAPKGVAAQAAAESPVPRRSLLRQARADAAALLFAPLFGLLWAYTDDSGVTGFLAATAVSAGVLFWLPSIYGSDPTSPRDA